MVSIFSIAALGGHSQPSHRRQGVLEPAECDATTRASGEYHYGRELELEFVEWTEHALIGRDPSGASVAIDHEDIERVQAERFSGGRTAMLGLAVVGVMLAIAASQFELPWNQPPEF